MDSQIWPTWEHSTHPAYSPKCILWSVWIPWAYRVHVRDDPQSTHWIYTLTVFVNFKVWLSNLLEFTLLLPDEPFGWLTPDTNHGTWHWRLCSGHMNTTKMPTLVHWDSLAWFTSFPSLSLGDGVWHCAYYLMPHVVTERMGSIRVVPQTTCGEATWISWHDAENHSH